MASAGAGLLGSWLASWSRAPETSRSSCFCGDPLAIGCLAFSKNHGSACPADAALRNARQKEASASLIALNLIQSDLLSSNRPEALHKEHAREPALRAPPSPHEQQARRVVT